MAARERMRQHFLVDSKQHGTRWDDLWAKKDFLPWDQGSPSPALIDALKDRKAIFGDAVVGSGSEKRRRRALVPGCGKGYDVLYLASLGYDAYGIDVSRNCIQACREFAEKHWQEYARNADEQGPGEYTFVCADFFSNEWVEKLSADKDGFDFIYDYTFLCALPPELRPAWSATQAGLLAKNGSLLCLEFPTYKEPHTGGPPFGLNSNVYTSHLSRPGEKLAYTEEGYPEPKYYDGSIEPGPNSLRRVDYWAPVRTFDIGKGTDKMSIWKHR